MIDEVTMAQIKPGAMVRVHERIKDGDKERESIFEGMVLARKHGSEPGAMFTVRGTIAAVGVEKIYPIHAPTIMKVDVLSSPHKVHRAKLYYMRNLSKKEIRQKMATTQDAKAKKVAAAAAVPKA